MKELEIRLLGQFSLVYKGVSINKVNSPRMQSLLAFLALRGGTRVSRQYLAALFWPESSEAQARSNLRHLLHLLYKAFPEVQQFLYQDNHTVGWQDDRRCALDVSAFEEAAGRGAAYETLQTALQFYSGDLLPGCYDEWLIAERERLKMLYLSVLDRMMAYLEGNRQFPAAIALARELLQREPLREETHRALIRLHGLNGDRAAGLQAYGACASLLRRELGVEPGAETRTLYQHLLDEQPQNEAAAHPHAPGIALVGRQPEWQAFQAAWDAAAPGSPQVILITGEAGIGKTRLAEEMIHWAGRHNLATASARCYPSNGTVPMAPIADWLRARPTAGIHPTYLAEATRLIPELQPHLPAGEALEPIVMPWQRLRFFEALVQILFSCCPVTFLLLEDLQWCDRDTLDWLAYLLRPDPTSLLAGARFCLILTLQWEEADRSLNVLDFLNRLRAGAQITELNLQPLNEEDTRRLAAEAAGRPLNSELLDRLYQTTEGNPLFVVETIRLNGHLPLRIKNVIASRLDRLTFEAGELAGLAAVVGRRVSYAAIAHASDLEENRLVNALDELCRRRILREQGHGHYEFSHEKIREVAYASLSEARRRLYHRRIAEALLAANPVDVRPGQVAEHFEQAGLFEQAVEQYQRAAEAALALFSNQEAIQLLQRAVALLEQLSPQPGGLAQMAHAAQIAHSYERIGDLYHLTGWQEEAQAAYHQALHSLPVLETTWHMRLLHKLGSSVMEQNP